MGGASHSKTATVLETVGQHDGVELQSFAPIKKICDHLCAFHLYAHDGTRQLCVHHFCAKQNDELRQCILYDSDKPDARLIGIEYMISRRLFKTLDPEEQKLWHSHQYEVKSGQLVALGVPLVAQNPEMEKLLDTYGKTWHTWQVDRGDELPIGPAQLMMAFTEDGQLSDELLKARDQEYAISTEEARKLREYMKAPAPPEPSADQPLRTGRALQVILHEVPFKPPSGDE